MNEAEAPKLAHRLEFAVFRLLETLAGLASMEACAGFGGLLGSLFRLASRRYRCLVRRNLRIATATDPLSPRELDALIAETFRRAGANFLCGFHSAVLPAEELRAHFELRNEAMVIRKTGEPGLVVVLAHQGNWEVLVRIARLIDGLESFGAVYRPLNNPLIDRLTHRRRTADGARLFSRRDGFHAPIGLLRAPGSLGVLADQRAGGRGIPLPFFGKMTSCTPLPDLMARRARAEVATAALVSTADGSWRVEFTNHGPSGGAAAIMRELEQAMRRSLPDVFWFHDRWRTDSRRPLSFFAPFDPEVARGATVPLRVLLTMPEGEDEGAQVLIESMLERRPDLRIEWLTESKRGAPDPRVHLHAWDRSLPPEQEGGLVERIDEAHPAPLDAGLLFGGTREIARALRRRGVRSIVGIGAAKKPWTHGFDRPENAGEWRRITAEMARVPSHDPE